jgi:hypothetical protein
VSPAGRRGGRDLAGQRRSPLEPLLEVERDPLPVGGHVVLGEPARHRGHVGAQPVVDGPAVVVPAGRVVQRGLRDGGVDEVGRDGRVPGHVDRGGIAATLEQVPVERAELDRLDPAQPRHAPALGIAPGAAPVSEQRLDRHLRGVVAAALERAAAGLFEPQVGGGEPGGIVRGPLEVVGMAQRRGAIGEQPLVRAGDQHHRPRRGRLQRGRAGPQRVGGVGQHPAGVRLQLPGTHRHPVHPQREPTGGVGGPRGHLPQRPAVEQEIVGGPQHPVERGQRPIGGVQPRRLGARVEPLVAAVAAELDAGDGAADDVPGAGDRRNPHGLRPRQRPGRQRPENVFDDDRLERRHGRPRRAQRHRHHVGVGQRRRRGQVGRRDPGPQPGENSHAQHCAMTLRRDTRTPGECCAC